MEFGLCQIFDESLDKIIRIGQSAEQNGFSRMWIPDQDTYGSCYAAATSVGSKTSTLKIGPGLTNPYTRHPVITAVEVATFHSSFKGRGIVGIGPGDYWFLQSLGMNWSNVTQTITEAIELIRQTARGDLINYSGQHFTAKNIQLRFKPPTEPPVEIGLGCRGPKLAETAGKVADVILLDGMPRKALPTAIGNVQKGEHAANRREGSCRIACFFGVGIDRDEQKGYQKAKKYASWSIAMAHPFALEAAGFTQADTKPILEALPNLDAATKLISDEMVQQFALTGTIDNVLDQIQEYQRSGLQEIILIPPDDPGAIETIKLFGREIIPHFRKEAP